MTIASYEQAKSALNGRRSKKLENNTYAELNADESIGIRLHATQVVIYFPDGRIRLTSGGWRTMTTKDRINTYSPFSISQARYQWTVNIHFDTAIRSAHAFHDGMVFKKDQNGVWDRVDESRTPTIDAQIPLSSLGVCSCRPGQSRDNCPLCEGTGQRIDFAAHRTEMKKRMRMKKEYVARGEEI